MAPFRQAARVSDPTGVRAGPVVKRFRTPDDLLAFDNGRLEVISIGGAAVAKASYAPGWRWSRSHQAAPWERDGGTHAGMVLAGRAGLRTRDGDVFELSGGDVFQASLAGQYDLWVVGERPCEILYLNGVEALIQQIKTA